MILVPASVLVGVLIVMKYHDQSNVGGKGLSYTSTSVFINEGDQSRNSSSKNLEAGSCVAGATEGNACWLAPYDLLSLFL